jgi:serine/threonine-protein kinase
MSHIREHLGQYDILGPIGAGGMGEVYAARDPILGRKVAIKVLPLRLSGDKDSLARFSQEARKASALNHPNIVTIHEVGTDQEGTPYIVMEHIEGKDLRSYIDEGPLQSRKLLDIAAQIADGLAAAHERGIVHRDLKPENLMVTNDGFVKILDFGLAKIIRPAPEDGDVTAQLEMPGTTPGTILGTVGYMSPEQATGRKLDFRSDQFALGAILYELATGNPAFDGDTAIDTLSAILHDDPEPIQKKNSRAPAPFCWIVGRLLSKEPNERYASTRDLAHELRAIRDRVATQASGVELAFPTPAWRGKPLLYVGLAVALAAVIALVVEKGPFSRSTTRSKNYLAVLRFKDLTGDANGQLIVDGFAETLTTRLAQFPSVQIMRPPTTDTAAASNVQQAGRDLGANIVLTGSMQRDRDRVRVAYRIIDLDRGTDMPGEVVDGSTTDLFGVQDRLAESVSTALKLGVPRFKPPAFDNGVSQQRYLEALGELRRYDNEPSVDGAINILQELAAQSHSASIQAALGRAYLEKFQLTHDAKWAAPASAACERAVAADAQNPDVHVTLGELRRQTGRLDDATREFKAALASQPNNADATLGLAATYEAAGNLKDAEAAYKSSIDLQPNFWGGYNQLGAFYANHARFAESVKMFEKVTQLLPDSLRGYNNLGGVYEQMGRYDDAIRVFQETLKKKPTAQAYSNLGTCYYYLGRYRDSAQSYERAVALTPNRYFYWANLGDAYRWVPGEEAKASAAFDKAIELAGNDLRVNAANVAVRARMADCLAKRGKQHEAQVEIDQAIQTDPKNVRTMYHAAVIASVNHDDRTAVDWLKRAIAQGYDRAEVERDPEFALLRESAIYKGALLNRVQ